MKFINTTNDNCDTANSFTDVLRRVRFDSKLKRLSAITVIRVGWHLLAFHGFNSGVPKIHVIIVEVNHLADFEL